MKKVNTPDSYTANYFKKIEASKNQDKQKENLPAARQELFNDLNNKASKLALIRTYSSLTPKKIIQEKYPTVGSLIRAHGINTLDYCVGLLLQDINESFDKDLKTTHIEELACTLTSGVYLNVTLEGLWLALQAVKQSKEFGKLTLRKVLIAVTEHLEEQSKIYMQLNENRHLANKFVDPAARSTEDQKELLKKAKTIYELHQINNKRK